MKILELVNRIPYPLNDGGNLGVMFFTKGFLEAGVSLSMLAMNTARHRIKETELPPVFEQLAYFQTIPVDNRIKPLPAFLNLFTKASYHVSRFISKDYENALISLLKQQTFDVIQLEGLFLTPYVATIRAHSKAKIVLREHNAEFLIWDRLAQQEKHFLKRKYLQLLTRRLKSFETKAINQVDLLLPVSEKDATIFKNLGATVPLMVQSYGIDSSKIPFQPAFDKPISLYHIGAMDWQPNQEGINFLLEKVMPKINTALPDLKLHLAGRNMPEYFFKNKWENVVVHGEIPNAAAFEKDKSILIVPLLSGGGIRIKILQGMAMGKAIITTSVGAEGIDIRSGKELLLADDAETMAEKIISLATNREKIKLLGTEARHFIEQNHDSRKMIQELLAAYQKLCLS